MKSIKCNLLVGLALLALSTLNHPLATAHAQGTAFTYQGRLNDGGPPASGSYDFRFRIASDALGNNFVAGPLLTNAIPVTGGLFTVTLNFGSALFTGSNYWLQVDVKTNNAGSYTTLTPLQALTPTPYAIFANTASNLSGTLAAAQLNGVLSSAQLSGTYSGTVALSNAANSFSGNGSGLTGVNAASLNGLSGASFWKTNGNAGANPTNGAFLGTADNLPLELKVNGLRALRLEPNLNDANHSNMVNLVGGSPVNVVVGGVYGATIAGGGAVNYNGAQGTNSVAADFGTISGGYNNAIQTDATKAAIGGGTQNTIMTDSFESVIGGGTQNTIQAEANQSTISGGSANTIQAQAGGSTVAGGSGNVVQSGAYNSMIGGGDSNVIQTNAAVATIAGGESNMIQTNAILATIGGGNLNRVLTNAFFATIGGGYLNTNSGAYATVPGGDHNLAGTNSFAAGHRAKAAHNGSFVWADSTDVDFADTGFNQFLIRAGGGVGIGTVSPVYALTVGTPDTPLTTTAQIGAFNNGNAFVVTRQTGAKVEMQMGVDNLEGVVSVVSDHPLVFRAGNGAGTGNHEYLRLSTNGFVGIGTSTPTNKLHVLGGATFSSGASGASQDVVWTPGSASWSFTSDRNTKEHLEPVNPQSVLQGVARLSIAEWNYIGYDQRHIGPMAQDFHAQFPLSADDKSLNDADLHGVALAAIQGLNQKLEQQQAKVAQKETEITELKQKNQSLERRLEALERIILGQ